MQQNNPTEPTLSRTRARTLRQHFFRRFFDNDTLSIEGETQTTVIRALSFCAIPGLMFAFWLMPSYPGRNPWTLVGDRYFFVLFSFVAMGTVATFEWEMLFPDRADFLILLPMPLKPGELFRAKGRALLAFLSIFLAAINLFALILFPAVSTGSHGNYFHAFSAHLAAVALSGIFAAFAMLAIQGILLCLLPSGSFRAVSTVIQSLSIAGLLLLFLLYPLIAGRLQALLSGDTAFAKWIPPLWFLGLYQSLMQDGVATATAPALATTALSATAVAILLSIAVYPLAWARQKKRALEGASQASSQNSTQISALLHRTLLPQPQQRAIFHFISQTIARSPRYQAYLAIYSGAGLALALCSILTLRQTSSHALTPALSAAGLHAVMPLLLFWLVVGLRASFAFPVDMLARWVFPINIQSPIFPGPSAKAAKTWVLLCCGALTCLMLAILLALHWNPRDLFIQAICGAALSILLADLFFLGRTQIPFTRPRMPGRSGLPLTLTLYAALFPALVLLTAKLALDTESRLVYLLWILLGTLLLHLALRFTDRLAQQGIIGGFPEDETDRGPQTLGLFQ